MRWLSWGKTFYRLYGLGSVDRPVRRIVWRALCQTRFYEGLSQPPAGADREQG